MWRSLIADLALAVLISVGGHKIGGQEGPGVSQYLTPITLENMGQLEEIEVWEGDGTAVSSVEFSRRDPNLIAYGTMAGYTYLGRLDDHTTSQLEYNTGPIVDVTFSLGSDYLASARILRDALVWTIDPPSIYADYQPSGTILTVAFSPDGYTIAIGGEHPINVSINETLQGGGSIALTPLDLDKSETATVYRIYENSGHVNNIAYSPNGTRLAAGIGGGNSIEAGGRVRIWDVETRTPLMLLEGHTEAVTDVKYDPTGQYLASASADRTVRLWDVATGKTVMTFKGHTDEVNAVAFSPDGRLLASVGKDGTVRFWEVATGEQVGLIDLNGDEPNPVWDVDFSADGTMVATASDYGVVQVWGVRGQ